MQKSSEPMKTRVIPHSNLTASVICLGTAEFGSALDASSAEKIIEAYLESRITSRGSSSPSKR